MSDFTANADRRRAVLFGQTDLRRLRGLEIGPLTTPIVPKALGQILYIDHMSTEQLVEKYKFDDNVDTSRIQSVDAVWGEQSLSQLVGEGSADYVVASHVLEHVPDFIGWLCEIEAVLATGGDLCVVLPDQRLSGDCRRRETVLVDVLDAYVRKARKPQTYQLLEGALGAVSADSIQLYRGLARPDDFPFIHTTQSALHLARHALEKDVYIDIHCWVFTPRSFAALMADLVERDLARFACSAFTDTRFENGFEFFVKLQTGRAKTEAIDSWLRMKEAAAPQVRTAPGEKWPPFAAG